VVEGEPPVPLIRTGLRDRLSRGFSHPVGAEAISRALRGSPRYDELWIAFGNRPLPLHPAPAECRDFRLAFAVIANVYDSSWHLSVPAVPSQERAVVRELLTSAGLPGARQWLCRPRPQTWHEGFRLYQVGYATDPVRVCFVESLNKRVIGSSILEVKGSGAEQGAAADRPRD
jgi:hypothetical protein